MTFEPTPLAGAWLLVPERKEDERGFFARIWCRQELASHGLVTTLAQGSISFNRTKGTLRGMHWQEQPHGETKIVRVTSGAIFDVIVDLRPASPTYCRWFGAELSADNRQQLYIPADFAHGFLTLTDNAELTYLMDVEYHPQSQRGARWNDPAFAINWPATPVRIAERDRSYPDFLSQQTSLHG